MDDVMKGQAAKSVLSDLLKKLRAFGLDDDDKPGDADPMDNDADMGDSTEGTDMDLMSKNPDMTSDAADPSPASTEPLDALAKPDAPETPEDDPLKAEMQKFFQKTDADKQGNPKGVRMNVTQIKAGPVRKGKM